MKRFLFTIKFYILCSSLHAQQLVQITLTGSGSTDKICFKTDDVIFVNFTKEGNIISWGVESLAGKYYNDPERLDQYMGRTEYYAATDPVELKGKIKYLGRTAFAYYTAYENELLKGKVKSIGNIYIDYFDAYNDAELKGKIRNAGAIAFNYYSSFDNEAYRGKFKNIGSTSLSYYASYDDKAYQGKIKSIGNQTFSYYSSFDRAGYQGAMKGNYQTQYLINGIKYLIRN